MHVRLKSDVASGSMLLILGIAVTIHSASSYALGTFSQMGTGLFPAALGVLLGVFGLAHVIGGYLNDANTITIEIGPAVTVFASIASFAILAPLFGLVPAVALMTFIASVGDKRLGSLKKVVLIGAVTALAYLIFKVGLGLQLPAITWPL